MTERPDGVHHGIHTTDDGLFGPDSVSWRAMSRPATAIGASTAAMVQMLYPPVMYVVDQTSSFQQRPDLRARRTAEYATTITFGDVETAEAAGESLRKIHARCVASHPDTGERLAADDPESLVWVNNALTWSLLRAWSLFGPELSAADRDRFVAEQKISARLVGADPDAVPSTVGELEKCMTAMEPKLAMTAPCRWFKEIMVAPDDGTIRAKVGKRVMTEAMVATMGEHHRELWGFTTGPFGRRMAVATTRALLGSVAAKLPLDDAVDQLRSHVDTHAFGARRTRPAEAPTPEPVS